MVVYNIQLFLKKNQNILKTNCLLLVSKLNFIEIVNLCICVFLCVFICLFVCNTSKFIQIEEKECQLFPLKLTIALI